MSDGKNQGGDDGVVTSAPASAVGSLLTDLLNEAKQEVQKERAVLEKQMQNREAEEKREKAREEAHKRDELQKKLIEETRRRNETLTRKEKEEQAVRTADQVRKQQSMLVRLQGAADAANAQAKTTKMVLLAVVAVLLVGGGITAALIATAPEGMDGTKYASLSDDVMKEVQLSYLKQKSADTLARLEAESARLDDAIKNAKSESERAQLLEQQKKKAEELLQAKEADALRGVDEPAKRRTGGGKKGGGLKINTGVF